MVTKTQAKIIKEICTIQKESISRIMGSVSLGRNNDEILMGLDIKRAEFDEVLIKTFEEFEIAHENPERFFELDHDSLTVALFILRFIKDEKGDKYPNAIENVAYKIKMMFELFDTSN